MVFIFREKVKGIDTLGTYFFFPLNFDLSGNIMVERRVFAYVEREIFRNFNPNIFFRYFRIIDPIDFSTF